MTPAECAAVEERLAQHLPRELLGELDDLVGEVERLHMLLAKAYDHGFAWLYDMRSPATRRALADEFKVGDELRKELGIG